MSLCDMPETLGCRRRAACCPRLGRPAFTLLFCDVRETACLAVGVTLGPAQTRFDTSKMQFVARAFSGQVVSTFLG